MEKLSRLIAMVLFSCLGFGAVFWPLLFLWLV